MSTLSTPPLAAPLTGLIAKILDCDLFCIVFALLLMSTKLTKQLIAHPTKRAGAYDLTHQLFQCPSAEQDR